VDVASGLLRVAGNEGLYRTLLRRFVETQSDLAQTVRAALRDQARGEAERFAHTAKSVAGNVGAQAAQDAAAQLEDALRQGLPEESLEPLLQTYELRMTELGRRIDQALEPADNAERNAPAPALAPSAAPALERLIALLSEADAEAAEYWTETVAPALRERSPATELQRLERAIKDFDFDVALRLAQALTPGGGPV
jgi:HPt (histidine-containing phosphotransfer) domain-containing protein